MGCGPLILINGELDLGKTPSLSLATRYADAVLRAGGLPLALPPIEDPGFLAQSLAHADGLLLAGGDDFDTQALHLGPTHAAAKPVPAEKQTFDLELARAAIGAGLPILGICYGMQLLSLAEGGTLHQHLPEDLPGCQEHRGGVRHAVHARRGSKLLEAVGVTPFEVISRHHQALSNPGPRWEVSGRDEEGLVEAIERPDHPFCLGVQWHPDLALDDPRQARLFAAFVAAADRHRADRQQTRQGAPLSASFTAREPEETTAT